MTVQSSAQMTDSVAMRVLDEVADARGVDPIALSPPLGSVIDPDALDTIVHTNGNSDVAVEFTYAGCAVSVTSDEVVVHQGVDPE